MGQSLARGPGEEVKALGGEAGGTEGRQPVSSVVPGCLLHLPGPHGPLRECSACFPENEVVIASVKVNITNTVKPAS